MSDQLLIHDGKVTVTTDEGVVVEREESDLHAMFRRETSLPMQGVAFPDGLKWIERRDGHLLVVHQSPPHVRQVRWIAPDSPERCGPGTTYRHVRLSVPYSLAFAMYYAHGDTLVLTDGNELYFSNRPVTSLADHVCYPALLNISKVPGQNRQRAWICTQHLRRRGMSTWTAQLHDLLEHVWNGGFNQSSERHEGASWYQESHSVPRLHPIEEWDRASRENDAFGLSVNWLPAPQSVGEIVEAMFTEQQTIPMPSFIRRQPQRIPNLIARFLSFAQKPK
jgi:hypothetical protein